MNHDMLMNKYRLIHDVRISLLIHMPSFDLCLPFWFDQVVILFYMMMIFSLMHLIPTSISRDLFSFDKPWSTSDLGPNLFTLRLKLGNWYYWLCDLELLVLLAMRFGNYCDIDYWHLEYVMKYWHESDLRCIRMKLSLYIRIGL